MPDPDKRHITLLIDRSGSMKNIREATQEGINGFLNEQAKEKIKTLVTLCQFDDVFEVVYENVPIEEVPEYVLRPRYGTALLDSMVETFERARARRQALPKDERPGIEHYLIVTDGGENSSARYRGRYDEVAKLVRVEAKRKGRIIQYMGANQDAIATAAQMGIQAQHSITYAANTVGTRGTWEAASATASAGASGMDYSYSPSMRSKAMGQDPSAVSVKLGDEPSSADSVVGLVFKEQEDGEE
jgi:hypothetical protein